MGDARTLYDVLGVGRHTSRHKIKLRYFELAKKLHPDTGKGGSSGAEEFKRVAEAYETLSCPTKRAGYDFDLLFKRTNQTQYIRTGAGLLFAHVGRFWRRRPVLSLAVPLVVLFGVGYLVSDRINSRQKKQEEDAENFARELRLARMRDSLADDTNLLRKHRQRLAHYRARSTQSTKGLAKKATRHGSV
jgi:curved DNA-binding protein CbpA